MTNADPIVASSKAIEETAKLGQSVARILEGSLTWFSGRLTEPLDEAIGWAFTDNLRYGRRASQLRKYERLHLLSRRVQANLDAAGVSSLKKPSDKLIDGLVAGAALEDDDRLQEMWAALTARALTDEDNDLLLWVAILRDLRPIEIPVLLAYARQDEDVAVSTIVNGRPARFLQGDVHDIEITRSLWRLGLIEPFTMVVEVITYLDQQGYGRSAEQKSGEAEYSGGMFQVLLTDTAIRFLDAVGVPAKQFDYPSL